MLAAVIYLQQLILSGLPNLELCTLLVMLITLIFPKQAPWSIGVFILLEGLTFGFGLWWWGYCYVWPLLMAITWLCRKNDSLLIWTVIAGGFGLGFGALFSPPYLFVGGLSAAFSYWISGVPFDIIHCIGNVLSVLLLWKPFYSVLIRLKKRLFAGQS